MLLEDGMGRWCLRALVSLVFALVSETGSHCVASGLGPSCPHFPSVWITGLPPHLTVLESFRLKVDVVKSSTHINSVIKS